MISFKDFHLTSSLQEAIDQAGFQTPTPVQEKVIPQAIMGRDILACAPTGTGKTASYAIPIHEALSTGRARARLPRALVLVPTRELAGQVENTFKVISKGTALQFVTLVGGTGFSKQEQQLNRGVDVIIATPGRFLDLVDSQKVLLTDIKVFVIDEADRMMDMGFIPDVQKIESKLPRIRQTLLLSATMPEEIKSLASSFLMNPKEIIVTLEKQAKSDIEEVFIAASQKKPVKDPDSLRRRQLREYVKTAEVESAIVFCNRKKDVTTVYRSLTRSGFSAAEIHGDLSQVRRNESLEAFKKGDIKFLVASDVAARGIDVTDLPCVINYDLPHTLEDYIHRIGRTGRAGKTGIAVTFYLKGEEDRVEEIKNRNGEAPSKKTSKKPPSNAKKTSKEKVEPKEGDVKDSGAKDSALDENNAKTSAGSRSHIRRISKAFPESPQKQQENKREDTRDNKKASSNKNQNRTNQKTHPESAGRMERPSSTNNDQKPKRINQEREPKVEPLNTGQVGSKEEKSIQASSIQASMDTKPARGNRAENSARTGKAEKPGRVNNKEEKGEAERQARPIRHRDDAAGFGDHVPAFMLK